MHPTTRNSGRLDVSASPGLDHTTTTSWRTAQLHVFFLATHSPRVPTYVSNPHLAAYMSHDMFSSMNKPSRFGNHLSNPQPPKLRPIKPPQPHHCATHQIAFAAAAAGTTDDSSDANCVAGKSRSRLRYVFSDNLCVWNTGNCYATPPGPNQKPHSLSKPQPKHNPLKPISNQPKLSPQPFQPQSSRLKLCLRFLPRRNLQLKIPNQQIIIP